MTQQNKTPRTVQEHIENIRVQIDELNLAIAVLEERIMSVNLTAMIAKRIKLEVSKFDLDDIDSVVNTLLVLGQVLSLKQLIIPLLQEVNDLTRKDVDEVKRARGIYGWAYKQIFNMFLKGVIKEREEQLLSIVEYYDDEVEKELFDIIESIKALIVDVKDVSFEEIKEEYVNDKLKGTVETISKVSRKLNNKVKK